MLSDEQYTYVIDDFRDFFRNHDFFELRAVILTDPPFLPKREGYNQIRVKTKHKLDEIPLLYEEDFNDLLREGERYEYLIMKLDDYTDYEIYQMAWQEQLAFKHRLIWNKGTIGLGHRVRKQHENIVVYSHKEKPYWHQKKAIKRRWHGSSQGVALSSVITLPPIKNGILGQPKPVHINQTPWRLWVPIIEHFVPPNAIVVDPFAGTGSIGLAVAYLNRLRGLERRYAGCDISDAYRDYFYARLQGILTQKTLHEVI